MFVSSCSELISMLGLSDATEYNRFILYQHGSRKDCQRRLLRRQDENVPQNVILELHNFLQYNSSLQLYCRNRFTNFMEIISVNIMPTFHTLMTLFLTQVYKHFEILDIIYKVVKNQRIPFTPISYFSILIPFIFRYIYSCFSQPLALLSYFYPSSPLYQYTLSKYCSCMSILVVLAMILLQ